MYEIEKSIKRRKRGRPCAWSSCSTPMKIPANFSQKRWTSMKAVSTVRWAHWPSSSSRNLRISRAAEKLLLRAHSSHHTPGRFLRLHRYFLRPSVGRPPCSPSIWDIRLCRAFIAKPQKTKRTRHQADALPRQRHSPIIASLIKAAENGKQVTVLVELKARFDEENNINWAKKLEKAGCHVIYGLTGLKTHCKIALVVRREEDGIRRYPHLGTGNYNDSTAKIYTDLGLFTCNEQFGATRPPFSMSSPAIPSAGVQALHRYAATACASLSTWIRQETENAKRFA